MVIKVAKRRRRWFKFPYPFPRNVSAQQCSNRPRGLLQIGAALTKRTSSEKAYSSHSPKLTHQAAPAPSALTGGESRGFRPLWNRRARSRRGRSRGRPAPHLSPRGHLLPSLPPPSRPRSAARTDGRTDKRTDGRTYPARGAGPAAPRPQSP